ncbi:mucoidy inhibitor MuiA family protein [Kribbella sindirgiensis]|uniref:Mucoidy inhibitor MuiA family protein n=1 Tax=Kribbella sindirgiensis TaxID=1124744 RepID=A0A4R0I6C9_9ACTN|nr:mucoidy inhibitor MuiA family protein [Kribbella sindirgiensis]TCC24451.1 mucoidy inhibitor MuiA family protein [Kribbella sindirgiensis]
MSELVVEAPVVAVTVYPDRARVTRRGRITVPGGDQVVYVEPLPLLLEEDSVRVSGRGPATVLGVDVATRYHAQTPDDAVAELRRAQRAAQDEIAALTDANDVQVQLETFLAQLAKRAGGSFARTLASGDPGAELGGFTESLAGRLSAVRATRRELTVQRREVEERLAAVGRRLAALKEKKGPDRHAAAVSLALESEAEVEIELSYVVPGASWTSTYDVRLKGDRLTLSWYGLITQYTGEDWPECDLTLSTARPTVTAKVPELDAWYLDRAHPHPPMPVAAAAAPQYSGTVTPQSAFAESLQRADFVDLDATVEQGVTAATYTPPRPVAVPADGATHRATIAAIELDADLDYITAPVRSTDVHLRATVVNSSVHTLPAGKAAVFHEADFVGSAALPLWAPGEDVELALGLDDRIRVERKLVRRDATKATLGSTRRRQVEYETTIENHTPRTARITVLDQFPVARDHEITVKRLTADPEPAETTDLGVVTWKLDLEPDAETTVKLAFRVDTGKSVELTGWRE